MVHEARLKCAHENERGFLNSRRTRKEYTVGRPEGWLGEFAAPNQDVAQNPERSKESGNQEQHAAHNDGLDVRRASHVVPDSQHGLADP